VTNNNGFWIGWLDLLTLSLFTITVNANNYSAIANLPTSQITKTCYPVPGNVFITGTITSDHYEVFLPFPAAANSEGSNQFSSDYCSVLLQQLPASEFAYLITTLHQLNGKHSLYCWRSLFIALLLSNGLSIVVTRLSGKVFTGLVPRKGLPIFACRCVAGIYLPSRCLAMSIHVAIYLISFPESKERLRW
jgi:hypothetical protein